MPRATLHRTAVRAAAALILACALTPGAGLPQARDVDAPARTAQFLSKTYLVDRKYKSMLGPQSTQRVTLLQADKPELLWVTGFAAQMVGADGEAPQSQEFMCHSNLDMNMNVHRQIFGLTRDTPSRMFTLSQGQQQIEFPKGFGIPVMSNEPFDLTTQVLNHNVEGRSIEVRHRVTVTFVRDKELGGPMKPLLQLSANGLVLVSGEGGYFNIPSPDAAVHGPGCLPDQSATGSGRLFTDDYGRQFSGHWLVKPGREVNRSNITRFMRLP